MAGAGPAPRRRLRLLVSHVVVCLVGILVGLSVFYVANGFTVPKASTPPGTVVLDTVQVDYFYLNGTPQIFGPNQQEVCPYCPLTLTGGTTFTIGTLLTQLLPANTTTTIWLNATSPIPFEEWSCSWTGPSRPAGWPPTGCPFTTDWHQPPFGYEVGLGGASISYPLTLAIPDPAPSLPGGFDIQLVFTVETSPFSVSS